MYHGAIQSTRKTKAITSHFADMVARIPDIERVYARVTDDRTIHLWTVVSRDEDSILDRVYDLEAALFQEYPDARFDFHGLARNRLAVSLSEAIPSGFFEVPRNINAAGPSPQTARGA